jgi:hypothetical protein
MFWARTESHRISRTFGLTLSEGFLFHLSSASGRLRCDVTGVPPQPNSQSDASLEASDRTSPELCGLETTLSARNGDWPQTSLKREA